MLDAKVRMLQTTDTALLRQDLCNVHMSDIFAIAAALTYIEAISASDMAIIVEPMPANILPYTNDAGPPFSRLNWKETPEASQAACRVNPKLMMAEGLM